jgi:hypothetical protein
MTRLDHLHFAGFGARAFCSRRRWNSRTLREPWNLINYEDTSENREEGIPHEHPNW